MMITILEMTQVWFSPHMRELVIFPPSFSLITPTGAFKSRYMFLCSFSLWKSAAKAVFSVEGFPLIRGYLRSLPVASFIANLYAQNLYSHNFYYLKNRITGFCMPTWCSNGIRTRKIRTSNRNAQNNVNGISPLIWHQYISNTITNTISRWRTFVCTCLLGNVLAPGLTHCSWNWNRC